MGTTYTKKSDFFLNPNTNSQDVKQTVVFKSTENTQKPLPTLIQTLILVITVLSM